MGRKPLEIGEHGDIGILWRDGVLYARAKHRDLDGVSRPVEASGPNETAAKRALRAKLRNRAHSGDGGDITSRSTLAAMVKLHLAKVDDKVAADELSPNTGRLYWSVWRNHLEPAAGGWKLDEVTPQRIERVLATIARHSADTAKAARVLLSASLRLAVRYGALAHNPIHDTDRTPAAKRGAPKALSAGQVADLLVKLSGDEQARDRELPDLVMWMLATSERLGNALAPRWCRIDLAAAGADIGPNVIRVKGVGLVVRGEHGQSSSKTASREIGLPQTAVRMLRARYLAAGDPGGVLLDARHQLGVERQGFVFPNARGTGPLDPSNVSKALKAALERAGYGWATSHVFRKTVASTLDEARMTPREISDRLGHSKTQITQDDYMKRRADSPAVTAAIEAMLSHGSVTRLRPRDEQGAG